MEKLLLSLGALADLKAPAAKVVSVGDNKNKSKVVTLGPIGPVPTKGFSKALKDMNLKEVSTVYTDNKYKAPTMRSNIKKGRR